MTRLPSHSYDRQKCRGPNFASKKTKIGFQNLPKAIGTEKVGPQKSPFRVLEGAQRLNATGAPCIFTDEMYDGVPKPQNTGFCRRGWVEGRGGMEEEVEEGGRGQHRPAFHKGWWVNVFGANTNNPAMSMFLTSKRG